MDPIQQLAAEGRKESSGSFTMDLLAAHRKGAVRPLYPYKIASPVLVDKTEGQKAVPGDEYVIWPN